MKRILTAAVLIGTALATGSARADDLAKYESGSKKSGYVYAEPETRAIQDDEFQNPGMLWIETGEKLWSTADGENGKSCQSCHNDAATSMKGKATHYPKFNAKAGKPIDMEERINICRENGMKAKPYAWESRELIALTAYVKYQSRGMAMDVKVDGPAAPFFEKGKEEFYGRRGQLDLSCANCHEDLEGKHLRAEILSQGQTNGFPTYRLKWQTLGSVQRRFRGCNKNVRAEPLPFGSDEYGNLELYTAWRSNGLPVEAPSVRK